MDSEQNVLQLADLLAVMCMCIHGHMCMSTKVAQFPLQIYSSNGQE